MVLLPFGSLENYSNSHLLIRIRMKVAGRNKGVFKGQTEKVIKTFETRVCRWI
jgi:hypothetical protein